MNEKEFKKLIKKDKYQVFLFSSRLPYPISFLYHPWIVTSNKSKINRWDVKEFPKYSKIRYGHVCKNWKQPWLGYVKNPFKKEGNRFSSNFEGKIEGNKGSIAEKMVKFIEKNAKNYPFKNKYRGLLGPH